MSYLKSALAFILNFTTGLGFYGIGLLGVALGLFFIGLDFAAWGFTGAFIFKNYVTIVGYVKDVFKKE